MYKDKGKIGNRKQLLTLRWSNLGDLVNNCMQVCDLTNKECCLNIFWDLLIT